MVKADTDILEKNKPMKKGSILVLSVLLFAACGTKKLKQNTQTTVSAPSTTPAVVVEKPSINPIKAQVLQNQLEYQTLALETTAHLDFPGLNKTVNINLRLEKGKKIWASVTFFGIEAARAYITPDKIQILNKIQGEYIEKPFSFLYQYIGEVDFQTLQDVLIGNVPASTWNQNPEIRKAENGAPILQFTIEKLIFQYQLNEKSRPESLRTKHLENPSAMQVKYSNFSPTELNLPTHVEINAQTVQSKVALIMDYKSVKRNIQLEFPFKVPSKYGTIN